ncbi:MAG TPA: hypothetical protein VGM64_13905 [Lacunisphaera sp.]
MQKVIVRFPEDRTVFSSQVPVGNTNASLVVEDGTHVFTLSAPADYQPASQEVMVTDTTATRPKIVTFIRVAETLAPWIPPGLLDLSTVAPSVDATVGHFSSLNLNWKINRSANGVNAFCILQNDAVTGDQWTLCALERGKVDSHRHNSGGDYGEMIITLAGQLSDLADDAEAVQPVAGQVAFRGTVISHQPMTDSFWVGVFHQPRGATAL